MEYLHMGERLKALRKENHFTLKQVSDIVGISISMISAYEVENRHPSYGTLLKLSRLYGVTCDYLISGEIKTGSSTLNISGLTPREINSLQEIIDIMKGLHENNRP